VTHDGHLWLAFATLEVLAHDGAVLRTPRYLDSRYLRGETDGARVGVVRDPSEIQSFRPPGKTGYGELRLGPANYGAVLRSLRTRPLSLPGKTG
jgi:hypothetical protein